MSRKLVVDASVAAKWLLKEERADEALSLLDETSFELWAPDYILSEVYNVLCKKVRRRELTEQAAEQLAEDLAAAPIAIRPFTDYLQQAFSLALTHSKLFMIVCTSRWRCKSAVASSRTMKNSPPIS